MIPFNFSGAEKAFQRRAGEKRNSALFASVSLIALCLGLPAAAQSVTASAPVSVGSLGGTYSYPYALSADGSTAVGEATTAGDNYYHAFRWTSAGGTVDLGTLGGNYSYAYGVSSNGSVVVGESATANNDEHAFRWTSASGMADLGTLGGNYSYAYAVSSNGSVVVGEANLSGDSTYHAFRWTSASGMADLGALGGTYSWAQGVSSDGSVVVGAAAIAGDNAYHAFRWTGAAGMADLGTLGGTYSTASAVNSNGSVVVGVSNLSGDNADHAFRWTSASGMADLGTLGGTYSEAYLVSSDGSVVAGQSNTTDNAAYHAFRWTSASGMSDLGTLGGAYTYARAMNSSGSVIVGESTLSGDSTSHAFRWTNATGMADLNTLMSSAGVNMTGITLTSATAISANGQVIAAYTGNTMSQSIVGGQSIKGDQSLVSASSQAYVVRYVDATVADAPTPTPAPVAGVTTIASVQNSANQLSQQRQIIMGQEHGFLDQLLQEGARIVAPNAAGVYGALGSATGGGSGRTQYGPLELIMGLGVASENYAGASMNDAFMAAAKLRYLHMFNAQYGLLGEIGGFYSPNGTYDFSRTYANGAGIAKGTDQVSGQQGYGFARIGALVNVTPADEFAPSLEIGRQSLQTGAYSELFSAINPFEAYLSSSYSALDVFKARAQWTHSFTSAIDATVWASWAHGFNYYDGSRMIVDGIGTFTPQYSSTLDWAEYGVRVGYKVNETITASVFVNGVAGDITGAKAHVGGGLSARF